MEWGNEWRSWLYEKNVGDSGEMIHFVNYDHLQPSSDAALLRTGLLVSSVTIIS
jgi:hypothetical protein